MAVPTYDDLLARHDVENSIMKVTFSDEDLRQFSLSLDTWEKLARFIGLPGPDIANIKSQGDAEEQRIRMLECWKQRCGSTATYEAMVMALLQIGRTDLAEKVITLRDPPKGILALESATANQILMSPGESNLEIPTSPASSSGIEDASSSAAMSPMSLPAYPSEQRLVLSLRELEEEFYDLVIFIEDTLENSEVSLNTITRRFRMLPQSVRRQHETDENYKETRRRILNSKTTKELFDNLTELKHCTYMTPDTLTHIIQDVKINEIHKKIEEYKLKLTAFKTHTKLRELIGISFPVPDYCMELTMEVEGWEDKTIREIENRAVNMVRRVAYGGSPQNIKLGWKGVFPGSTKATFILMVPIKLTPEEVHAEEILKYKEVVSFQIDGHSLHRKQSIMAASVINEIPSRLWTSKGTSLYQSGRGSRDVLILTPDLSHPHPEAVARRSGQMTEEDKMMLQRQGLPPDSCHKELDIVTARYKLVERYNTEVKSGQSLSQREVLESIAHLLKTTQKDGVTIHYIGAGRRGTGDWCFEDGFITFRDIAQLYLRALSHNFKGRVLTIVSDCSYSGCLVRDCMEFLDKQGVQPCGHKAREKGMLIKVYASCKSNEIPTKYCFSKWGMKNKGILLTFLIPEKILETQTTDAIDPSFLICTNKSIDEPCTLPPDLTWKSLGERSNTEAWLAALAIQWDKLSI